MNALFNLIGNFFRMFQIFITIAPWEHAVRTRLGKHVKKLGPGPHIKLPLIDVVYKQSVRLRRAFLPSQTLSTKDGATLVVGGSIAYQIKDIEKLYTTLHHAESTIVQAAAAKIADAVLSTSKADINPDALSDIVTLRLAGDFEKYGLSDVSVDMTDFAFIRAIRLINDQRYGMDGGLTTNNPSGNNRDIYV